MNIASQVFRTSTNGRQAAAKNERHTVNNVRITPERAQELLNMSTGNRKPRRRDLTLYKQLIESGTWINTGEPIIISVPCEDRPQGRLLDGHTRLTACVMAGKPFVTDITYNVPEEAFYAMNADSRTASNHLQILGIQNVTTWASVYHKLHAYMNQYENTNSKPHPLIMKNEMAKWIQESPYASVDIAVRNQSIVSCTCAQVAAIVIEMAGCKTEIINEFFEQLIAGANLSNGNPLLTLRNALLRGEIKILARDTSKHHRYIGMIINVFNYWAAGKQLGKIYSPPHGRFVQPIIPAEHMRDDANA